MSIRMKDVDIVDASASSDVCEKLVEDMFLNNWKNFLPISKTSSQLSKADSLPDILEMFTHVKAKDIPRATQNGGLGSGQLRVPLTAAANAFTHEFINTGAVYGVVYNITSNVNISPGVFSIGATGRKVGAPEVTPGAALARTYDLANAPASGVFIFHALLGTKLYSQELYGVAAAPLVVAGSLPTGMNITLTLLNGLDIYSEKIIAYDPKFRSVDNNAIKVASAGILRTLANKIGRK